MGSKSEIGPAVSKKISPWGKDASIVSKVEVLRPDKSHQVTSMAAGASKTSTHGTYFAPLMVFDLQPAEWSRKPENLAKGWNDLFLKQHLIDHTRATFDTYGKFRALEHSQSDELWHKVYRRHFERSVNWARAEHDDAELRARTLELRALAEEDEINMSRESETSMINFVVERNLSNPIIVLTNKGDCRAIWRRDAFSVEIDFLTGQRLSMLYSRYRPAGPAGRYAALDSAQTIIDRWADVFYELRNRN